MPPRFPADMFPSFGERLTIVRRRRGLTMKALAELVGCAASSLSAWEHDRRDMGADSLKAICLALNITSNYLLGLIDEPRPLEATS